VGFKSLYDVLYSRVLSCDDNIKNFLLECGNLSGIDRVELEKVASSLCTDSQKRKGGIIAREVPGIATFGPIEAGIASGMFRARVTVHSGGGRALYSVKTGFTAEQKE
jgi:hypothetical protein